MPTIVNTEVSDKNQKRQFDLEEFASKCGICSFEFNLYAKNENSVKQFHFECGDCGSPLAFVEKEDNTYFYGLDVATELEEEDDDDPVYEPY
jgi:hypothetical protein